MDNSIVAGVVQGGALVLLAMVLWQVGKKIDLALSLSEKITMRLIDLVSIGHQDNDKNDTKKPLLPT